MAVTTWQESFRAWKERLLQLDRRNTLLYFKPNRAVRIVDRDPDQIVEELVSKRGGLAFDFVEPRRKLSDPPERPDRPGDLHSDLPLLDLQRRLGALRTRDRQYEDEQGLNVLFLAVGVLHWIDADDERAQAPLILIPCDLERASPRDPYYLVRESDDAGDNATLRYKLSLENLDLPEFADDPPSAYLHRVKRVIRRRRGWEVSPDIYLATLSYSKIAMHQDLDQAEREGIDHPLVLQLAGSSEVDRHDDLPKALLPGDAELAGGGLDDLLDLRRQFAVLPADASQLRAIEAARSGANLVIHGPPGTGKSQTIANIIATLLAEGRHVLFVSEKTAALDVVKRRLEACGLGTFCLDLHSERGKKASVYEQLRQSLRASRPGRARRDQVDKLEESRRELNETVRSLHRAREPLGRSLYEMHGVYADVQDAPAVHFAVNEVERITRKRLDAIEAATARIARWPQQYREHDTNLWRPLRAAESSVQLPDSLRRRLQDADRARAEFEASTGEVAAWVGAPATGTVADVEEVAELCRLLASAEPVEAKWLSGDVPERLRRRTADQRAAQRDHARMRERVEPWFGQGIPPRDFREAARLVDLEPAERMAVQEFLGVNWQRELVADPDGVGVGIDRSELRVGEVQKRASALAELLHGDPPATWGDLRRLTDLATSLDRLGPVPSAWMDPTEYERIASELEQGGRDQASLVTAEAQLRSEFSEDVVGVVDTDLLRRLRVDYQSRLKRWVGGYRLDTRVLRGFLLQPRKRSREQWVSAVESILALIEAREEWAQRAEARERAVGNRFRDTDTDWEAAGQALDEVQTVRVRWPRNAEPLEQILTDRHTLIQIRLAADHLQAAIEAAHETIPEAARTRLTVDDASLAEVAQAAAAMRPASAAIAEVLTRLRPDLARQPADLETLADLVKNARRLRQIEGEVEQLTEALRADFGDRYEGLGTDWDAIESALAWTEDILSCVPGAPPGGLVAHVSAPAPREEYRARAARLDEALARYISALDALNDYFNVDQTAWTAWRDAPFGPLREWISELSAAANGANDWADYQRAIRDLHDAIGSDAIGLLREASDAAALIPAIVRRRVVGAWLDAIYAQEPRLRSFTARDHEALRAAFKELDEAYPAAARRHVRARGFEAYPDTEALGMQSGQLAVLQREIVKHRRRLSVRKLFQRIPQLLLSLKPCILVSPLAVSQYLPRGTIESETIAFDTVVFDEASQVFPEDAVPALLRAQQVIVVGDQQQLPPTNFFRSAADSDPDDDDDDDPNALVGMESILDAMVGQVGRDVAEVHLNVHYRSRHESLIRYSNHYFYENRLLTFPPPEIAISGSGIREVYLEEGRYETGASRTNRAEADALVDRLIDQLRTAPQESVGVVTVNLAQADLITSLLDECRINDPSIEEWFAEDLPEPLFVKNLETVQGDERDHIFLSTVYGPTPGSGAVPNRFGPINREGGQRRLNVAITRARNSMTVVHSLRPRDIVSTQEGSRLLRRFLEYLADPVGAFERQVSVDPGAEPESPFEEAVLRALQARGYVVDAQVGVSGYRIDLAIRSGDGVRYDLGIECDGATYHSSPAARDRDWLRQSVLEGLGWCIHRVWSTSWIRSPDAEVAAIEAALERCRAARAGEAGRTPIVPANAAPRPRRDDAFDDGAAEQHELPLASQPELFEEYWEADLAGFRVGPELHHEVSTVLQDIVCAIVEVEGPVHFEVVLTRIRERYGVRRAGSAMQARVVDALKAATKQDRILRVVPPSRATTDSFWVLSEAVPEPRAGARPIQHIADEELRAGVLKVLSVMYGGEQEELVRATATQFGFLRTGAVIQSRIAQVISGLVQDGSLTESFGQLSLRMPRDRNGAA